MSKMTSTGLGRYGEEVAAQFLLDRGYEIRQRNLRAMRREVDIVAEKDGVVVFVEVKTRTDERFAQGLESVTPAKQQRLIQAARVYSDGHRPLRFDVISVVLDPDTRTARRITHVEDAFRL